MGRRIGVDALLFAWMTAALVVGDGPGTVARSPDDGSKPIVIPPSEYL